MQAQETDPEISLLLVQELYISRFSVTYVQEMHERSGILHQDGALNEVGESAPMS